MKPKDVLDLYDDAFAADYDERFLLTWWGEQGVAFEVGAIRDALGSDGRLLDVACGTGFVLSQFPTHQRAGLDLSPAMLARAQARPANHAVALRTGDYREGQSDWIGQWDVVSCMWFAYCYVDTVTQVDTVIDNLARWAKPSGAVFLPVCDPEGIGLDPIRYRKPPGEFSSEMRVTSFTWSWDDSVTHKWHHHLVAPHLEYLIELFSRHFLNIRILEYPVLDFGPYIYRRRAVLASGKRQLGDQRPSEVTRKPPPPKPIRDPVLPTDDPSRGDHQRRVARRWRSLAKRGLLRSLYALARHLEE